MISVEEADKIIFNNVKGFSSQEKELFLCTGCILREDVIADRDFPPHDRATMDGIAIQYDAHKKGIESFEIIGIQKAGIPALNCENENQCCEIMTGGLLPLQCDCVVPVEDISIENNIALCHEGIPIEKGQYIHKKANDYKSGDTLIPQGSVINAQKIAIAAAVGKATLKISCDPKIAIIGTGDEIVPVESEVKPYQIRQSNAYAIQSALNSIQFTNSQIFHLNDERDELMSSLKNITKNFEIIIISGGISKGKYDFIPEVLEALNIQFLFHRVNQRPGGPFGFAVTGDGNPIFALPGNPISTQVCTYRYVLPYLYKAGGVINMEAECAKLACDFKVNNSKVNFIPVTIKSENEQCTEATPVDTKTSGNFAALASTHGFMELPSNHHVYKKGMQGAFYRW